jgi:hypothetical protein
MQKKSLIAIGVAAGVVIAGGLSLIGYADAASKQCVVVHVDYGVLDQEAKFSKCVAVTNKTNALDVLKNAGITVEGTGKYGAQIACRVNSLPSSTKPVNVKDHEDYVETCSDMPAAFAYWAVLVKKGTLPWGWAETGVDQVKLSAGDSLGLVFADNDKIRWPK